MSFTVSDFDDLKRLLGEHPEWRVELRHLLLTDDMEALPGIVRELVEAQRRTEERLTRLTEAQARTEDRVARLEEVVQQLAFAQRETAEQVRQLTERTNLLADRMDQLTVRINILTERMNLLSERMDRLTERMDQLTARMDELAEKMGRLTDKVGWMDGVLLELLYGKKVPGYFGRWLRRAKTVDLDELWEQLETHLGHEEMHSALMADLVVRGRVADLADRPEVYLSAEVSAVIDEHDVERAIRRAELFRRAAFAAVPAVVGREANSAAKALAERRGVAVIEEGKQSYWEAALTHWPAA